MEELTITSVVSFHEKCLLAGAVQSKIGGKILGVHLADESQYGVNVFSEFSSFSGAF